MPRKAREILLGFPVHVTQRGEGRMNIFLDDRDKEFYLRFFLKLRKQYKVKLYAWCLMDNHVHFVLEPENKKGLSKLFQRLNTKYWAYFNSKYNRKGRLFGGRFYSAFLDEEHFAEAVRYVELNPQRAGMEVNPGVYYWTSAHERLGKRNKYFLNKLPDYLNIRDWWEYLTEEIGFSKIWDLIRSFTIKGISMGDFSNIGFKKSRVVDST